MSFLQGIHLPHRHRWEKKEAKEREKTYKFLHNSLDGFCSFRWRQVEFSRFCNSLRNVSSNGRGSLLLANNSSSCSKAVSLYEKIWENDAVCVYHDSVCRTNPIKMMKKPRLRTSWGWAACGTLGGVKGDRALGEGSDYCRRVDRKCCISLTFRNDCGSWEQLNSSIAQLLACLTNTT